jgi:Pyridoxamine 5'-phosphate oxidase
VSGGAPGASWKAFADAAPALAETGRALLTQFGVGLAFLATVRGDGGPRVHPVCPVLSEDRLFVLITPGSPKRADLARDGRYALQTFPQPKAGSDEFYLAGVAQLVADAPTRQAVMRDARHQTDAAEVVFELTIERAMHTRWEHALTPQMRPRQEKWRAPGGRTGE